jgi:hypothetical protein
MKVIGIVVPWLVLLLIVAVFWAVRIWQVASSGRDGWWYR